MSAAPMLPGVVDEHRDLKPANVLRRYEFFVAGEPRPMGSKSAFAFKGKDGRLRAVVTDSPSKAPHLAGKLTSWKDSVTSAALVELGPGERVTGAVSVSLEFHLARPGGHLGKDGRPRASAPRWPATKPDLDKLARSTLDALAVALLADDSRVVTLTLAKRYADRGPTGARIVVEEMA